MPQAWRPAADLQTAAFETFKGRCLERAALSPLATIYNCAKHPRQGKDRQTVRQLCDAALPAAASHYGNHCHTNACKLCVTMCALNDSMIFYSQRVLQVQLPAMLNFDGLCCVGTKTAEFKNKRTSTCVSIALD